MNDVRQQAGLLLICIQVQQIHDAADVVHIILGRRRTQCERRESAEGSWRADNGPL